MRGADFATAWAISDAVLARRDPAERDDPRLPYHRRWVWDGRDFTDRHVLVRCYHGLGDTIQFARFLPELAKRAASVTVEVQPSLLTLLKASGLRVRLIPFDPAEPHPDLPCSLEIMELAHALRLAPSDVAPPYLRSAQTCTGDRCEQREAARPVVGLCWRAGEWDRERSVSAVALARSIPSSWQLLHLQADAARSELGACRFLNDDQRLIRIHDTAALIARADLVVTVDTVVAHLAGAMGKAAIVLLKHVADWRWEHGESCTWYPRLRLIRQPAPGAWDKALALLHTAIARRAPG
jgi:hypothetical protein